MSAANYKPGLSLVLGHEGGYVNHPLDPGGATNKGITQAVYDAYRKVHGLPTQSVKLITSLEITQIYRDQYWKRIAGDDLPVGLDYAVFDFAVNSGVSRAVRYLQKLVGADQDGNIGALTLADVFDKYKKDPEQIVVTYCANRLAFLKSLSTFPTFGLGWTRRVVGMKAGYQVDDNGVLDVAVTMCRANLAFVIPPSIGTMPGEVAGKAVIVNDDHLYYPVAAPEDIKALAAMNDQLADKILLSTVE